MKENLACKFLKRIEGEISPSKIPEGIRLVTEIIQRLRT